VLLIASDFDPDGEEIAHSFARSLRDDFGLEAIDAIKVALTAEHVAEFSLPPRLKAKHTSSTLTVSCFFSIEGEVHWGWLAACPERRTTGMKGESPISTNGQEVAPELTKSR
jgi:hypothetical protein